ncbi:MAG: flagellar biosynthetic protein FliR [Syntrophothermus sp.]
MDILGAALGQFHRYLLVLSRVLGMFIATPFFSSRNIPGLVKLGLALILAFFLLPAAAVSSKAGLGESLYGYVAAMVAELAIGLTLGYIVLLTFGAMQMAGEMIDIPIGFSLVNILDPQSGQQVPIMAQFQYVLAILLFLIINGHHYLIEALARTFELVPLGGWRYEPAVIGKVVEAFGAMFLLGFKISLPVVAAVFLTDIALGVVARAVPQINVFIIGFPAKIVVGLVFVMLALPLYVSIVEATFSQNGQMFQFFYRLFSRSEGG